MKHHERDGTDGTRPSTLPTRHSPAGDPGTNPDPGNDIRPGQPEIAGMDPDAVTGNAGEHAASTDGADAQPRAVDGAN